MNTKRFFLILLASVITFIATAKNPNTTVYNNVVSTENGKIEEYTILDNQTQKPLKKSAFTYDLNGNLLEKIVYNWVDHQSGWVENQKLSYQYEDGSQPSSITLVYWDRKENKWSDRTISMDYSNINNE